MITFNKLREGSVRSADKKPQIYRDANGKTKTRMVPVDRDVIKTEASDIDELSTNTLSNYKVKSTADAGNASVFDIKRQNKRIGGQKMADNKLRKKANEEVEQIDELTAAEKKLVNQMYNKDGTLTALGKKIFAKGQNK